MTRENCEIGVLDHFWGEKDQKSHFLAPFFGASGSPVFPGQVRDHLTWFSGCPSQELRFEGSWSDVGPTVPEIWPFAQKLFLSAKGQNSTFPKWWFYHFGAGGPARVVQITWNNSKWAASDAQPCCLDQTSILKSHFDDIALCGISAGTDRAFFVPDKSPFWEPSEL